MNELFTLLNRGAEPEPEFRITHYDGGVLSTGHQHAEILPDAKIVPHLLRASGHCQSNCPVEIAIHCHVILSYTPSGAWIDRYEGKKFVNLRAGKQWASMTEAEAIDQLYWRKCTQVRILESRLEEAQAAKETLEKHFGKKPRAPRRYSSDYDYY